MSLGIRAKLYVGFGLMMGLMTAVAGVGWASPNPNLLFGALAAALLVALIAGIAITRALERPLRDSAAFLRELAEGDLSLRMSGAGGPEMDELAGSCNAFLDQLQAMVANVEGEADGIVAKSSQLTASASRISTATQGQVEAAGVAEAAVQQMVAGIDSVAASAEQVRETSRASLEQTARGNDTVVGLAGEITQVEAAVQEIASSIAEFVTSTTAITDMTRQVKDIAEQTNLLALNAAIEAARAGEQGRGFAVVADEVRRLAEKSAESASKINSVTDMLGSQSQVVQAAIVKGMKSLQSSQAHMGAVSSALAAAGQSVSRASEGVDGITASVMQQTAAGSEIAQQMRNILGVAQDNYDAASEAAHAVGELEQCSRGLEAAVLRFRTADRNG